MILAIDAFGIRFPNSDRISTSLPSSFDRLREPFGRPSIWPLALAAAIPSRVRSEIRSRSISANSPNIVTITSLCISWRSFKTLFRGVHDGLGEAGRAALDALFLVGDGCRISPWNDLKADAPKATTGGLRELLKCYDQLSALAGNTSLLRNVPVAKRHQLALEGMSLDAASMADMEAKKRYAVTLALIERQLAKAADNLCDMFCKQMMKVQHLAGAELEGYLPANQEKTDEILRHFAALDAVPQSDQPVDEQIASARQLVTARPDLCEFSRTHAEFGGKNECRFMWRHFKARRGVLLRILAKLPFATTSQDGSFERTLAFVLAKHRSRADWIALGGKGEATLTPQDLDWAPEKWRKLITGEGGDKVVPSRH